MNESLRDVLVAANIMPGNIYFLCEEDERNADLGARNLVCLISCDRAIFQALEMALYVFLAETCELGKSLRPTNLSGDCYVLSMRCYDQLDESEVDFCLYLHRIPTFEKCLDADDFFERE
jgi:hypothetical protein